MKVINAPNVLRHARDLLSFRGQNPTGGQKRTDCIHFSLEWRSPKWSKFGKTLQIVAANAACGKRQKLYIRITCMQRGFQDVCWATDRLQPIKGPKMLQKLYTKPGRILAQDTACQRCHYNMRIWPNWHQIDVKYCKSARQVLDRWDSRQHAQWWQI